MTQGNEEFVRFEEESAPSRGADEQHWKILVVDDEADVHKVTALALGDFRFDGCSIEILSAYSAAEARAMIQKHADVALILLDVVMETDHAGLDFVHYVRRELRNLFVRIVLRTGQPGRAPERQIITEYDINDYKSKGELTATRLFTVVYTGLSSYRDLRELHEIRQLLARRTRELAGANEELERFSAAVAEDLQAPLRAIVGFAGLLNMRLADQPGETRKWLEGLTEAVRRAQTTVSELKDYTQPGNLAGERQSTDVESVLSLALLNLKDEIDRSQAVIVHGQLPSLHAQPSDLLRVFQNLIANALRFRAERPVKISVNAERRAGLWVLSVSDNGRGLPPEVCQSLAPGAAPQAMVGYLNGGKGLAICRRIVERQGGALWATAEPGGGSRICFTLSS